MAAFAQLAGDIFLVALEHDEKLAVAADFLRLELLDELTAAPLDQFFQSGSIQIGEFQLQAGDVGEGEPAEFVDRRIGGVQHDSARSDLLLWPLVQFAFIAAGHQGSALVEEIVPTMG